MSLSSRRIVVIKLGGSLLTFSRVAERIALLLGEFSDDLPLLIVGGGKSADIIREWDSIYQLGNEAAHWLALEAMKLNEALLCQLLPKVKLVTSRDEADAAWSQHAVPLLSTAEFLRQEEQTASTPLPHHWGVTADSVAAWVTLQWPADCLLLAKSIDIPDVSTQQSDAIDCCFVQYSRQISQVYWVNLRQDILSIEELSTD